MSANLLEKSITELQLALNMAKQNSVTMTKQAEEHVYEYMLDIHRYASSWDVTDTSIGKLAQECYHLLYQTIRALVLNPDHLFSLRTTVILCINKVSIYELHRFFAPNETLSIHKAIQALENLNDVERTARHLIFLTPESAHEIDPEGMGMFLFNEQTLSVSFPTLMGFLNLPINMGTTIEAFQNALAEQQHYSYALLKAQNFPFSLHFIFGPWMRLTYWTNHQLVKRVRSYINSIMRDFLYDEATPRPLTYQPGKRSRPKLLIAAEFFNFSHVMFRCYGMQVIKAFRDFDIVIATGTKTLECKAFQQYFNHAHLINLDTCESMASMVEILQHEQADIIWYPSVGMSYWGAAVANLRLAPIQIASIGLPDTTRSAEIDFIMGDYTLFSDDIAFNNDYYSERLIRLKSPHGMSSPMYRFPIEYPPLKIRLVLDGEVHIGINAFSIKLNNPYIDFLKKVEQNSPINIVWHFFPNLTSIEFLNLERVLSKEFTHIHCHKRADYYEYLVLISECDFLIGSFPFTGTNTIADAFKVGVPVISKVGKIAHERTEFMCHTVTDTVETLCAETTEDMMKLIIGMIQDNAHRVKLSEKCAQHADLLFQESEACASASTALLWAMDQYPFDHLPKVSLVEHE